MFLRGIFALQFSIYVLCAVLYKNTYQYCLGVMPRLISRKSFIKCTEPINTTAKAVRLKLWRERLEPMDASVHLNISADEHLPAGADYPWTTWKALNRLRTQVGRSRVNMSKWGYSNETETCDCGIRQTM